MKLNELEITDGFIGSMGKRYHEPTSDELETAITEAVKLNDMDRETILSMIESGKRVKWCESPNYYYDHSYGTIQKKCQEQKIELIKCDCGHSVPAGSVMNASVGTSCPDCYDRMSM